MFDKVRPKGKKQLVKAAQNLMNNYKPSKIAMQLGSLLTDIDLQRAQFPHQLVHDTKAGKMFIQTDFNKDGSSYRSPYTNRYYPQRDEAYYPTPPLREIEQKGNILFDEYTRLYYGKQALGNFYAMQKQQLLSFAYVCYNSISMLIQEFNENGKKGCWNSTNIIEVAGDPSKSFNYKIQTIVLYEFQSQDGMSYSGSLKKSKVESKKLTPQYEIEEFHLIAIGKMVQDMQTYMTQQIEGIYLAKTKDIIFKTRVKQNREYEQRKKKLAKQLMELRPRDFVLQ